MSTTNDLIHETSPYLLQHAHNPVDWKPWNQTTLQLAVSENKPLLISIGYSACHWCHVMEHESFEDSSVADIMNQHFVCIKVDREERPDVDQVYMDAVQLMTGSGGWPLNCFALPDGRPFYGGTYFKKEQWIDILNQLAQLYRDEPSKVVEYAEKLSEGLQQMDAQPLISTPDTFSAEVIETAVNRWSKNFDHRMGGPNHAPKFPLPNNYQFLLAHAVQTGNEELKSYVLRTLNHMAYGGIYDQIGGGFARYSTDALWKVPHFEKMLYDNGQLLSLYAQAYKLTRNPLYKSIIDQTGQWLKREMMHESGAFYSALDADSEGEEGKYYVWTDKEIASLANDNYPVIADYFNVNQRGKWEHGNFILLRHDSDEHIAKKHNISLEALHSVVNDFIAVALDARSKRTRPGLDDKSLTSWNALATKGLCEAFSATQNKDWIDMASQNLDFLTNTQMDRTGRLWHSYKHGKSTINGYLEDYAHVIYALLTYYETTFDKTALDKANLLVTYVDQHFDKNQKGLYYFKSKEDDALVVKKTEVTDNVIPASNSIMATCLFKLSLLMMDESMNDKSKAMLAQVEHNFNDYPSGYSQWMLLHQYHSFPYFEVAIVGKDCLQKLEALQNQYIPNAVICGSEKDSNIPVLDGKVVDDKTLYYACKRGACQLPVEDTDAVLNQLR